MMGNIDKSSESFLKQLYDVIDLGIHVEHVVSDSGVRRYVREIVLFLQDQSITLYHHQKKRNIEEKVLDILGVKI